MTETLIIFFQLIVVLFSVVIHEVSHGAVALALGDTTARDARRLTLNPLRHLDPFGSVILPFMLSFLHMPIFGWAKPVPYNPYVFRNPRKGSALVGFAGPLSNLLLAAIFAVGLRFLSHGVLADAAGRPLSALFLLIVMVNLSLAVFNLIPIPPLDGSKLLFALVSDRYLGLKLFLEQWGLLLFIFLIVFLGQLIFPIVLGLCGLLTSFDCIFGPQ